MVPYGGNTRVREALSATCCSADGHEFSESTMYIKVSLNRNTHKTRLCVDWSMKVLSSKAPRSLALYFPQEQRFRIR